MKEEKQGNMSKALLKQQLGAKLHFCRSSSDTVLFSVFLSYLGLKHFFFLQGFLFLITPFTQKGFYSSRHLFPLSISFLLTE